MNDDFPPRDVHRLSRGATPFLFAGGLLLLGSGMGYGYLQHRPAIGSQLTTSVDSADVALPVARATTVPPMQMLGDTALGVTTVGSAVTSPSAPQIPMRAGASMQHATLAASGSAVVTEPRGARAIRATGSGEDAVVEQAAAVAPAAAPVSAYLPAGSSISVRFAEAQCGAAIERNMLVSAAVVGGTPDSRTAAAVFRVVGRTLTGDRISTLVLRGERILVDDQPYMFATDEITVPVDAISSGGGRVAKATTGALLGGVVGAVVARNAKGAAVGAAMGAGAGAVMGKGTTAMCIGSVDALTARLSRSSTPAP